MNQNGEAVLRNVDKATAERYAAFPDMARALRDVYAHDRRLRDNPEDANRAPVESVIAALARAGVPLP